MSDYATLLETCIHEAATDRRAESLLRSIVQKVAARVTPAELAELGEVVLQLHKQQARRLIERN